jgi:hypothetical protein
LGPHRDLTSRAGRVHPGHRPALDAVLIGEQEILGPSRPADRPHLAGE